ncbi:MAG: glycosyltransferase family 1 protein, partial [Planctomycetota bacterium]
TAPEDASLRFEPGDVDGLRDRLERVVRDANVYASLRAGAERARSATRPWERVADAFRAVLEEVAE